MELATDIDITGVRTHGEAGEQAALDQLVRVPAHDVPVLAGPGFTLVGVDDQIVRAAVRLLRHERPFEAGREAGAAAADRKSTRLNSSHYCASRMPSSA